MDPKQGLDLSIYSSETVEIEIDGETYRGIRFITGTQKLRQEVRFNDLQQLDPKRHSPRDVARMRRIARVILRDLVEQWKAQEARHPVRVEPRPNPKRRSPRAAR